jgi:hypothetical protein
VQLQRINTSNLGLEPSEKARPQSSNSDRVVDLDRGAGGGRYSQDWAWPKKDADGTSGENRPTESTKANVVPQEKPDVQLGAGQRWGAGIEWPATWRNDPKTKKPDEDTE